jgi:hypothetical protein
VTSSAAPAASAISPKTRQPILPLISKLAPDCVLVPRKKVAGLFGLASVNQIDAIRPSPTNTAPVLRSRVQ